MDTTESTHPTRLTLESVIEHFPYGLQDFNPVKEEEEAEQTFHPGCARGLDCCYCEVFKRHKPYEPMRSRAHQRAIQQIKPFPFEGILLALLSLGSLTTAAPVTVIRTTRSSRRPAALSPFRLGDDVALTIAMAQCLHGPKCVAENGLVCIRPRFAHCVPRPVSWSYGEAPAPGGVMDELLRLVFGHSPVSIRSTSFFRTPAAGGRTALQLKWQTLDRESAEEEDVQQAVALATLPSPQVLLKNAVPKSDDYRRRSEERTRQAYLLRLAEVARLAEEKDLSHALHHLALRCQRQEEDEEREEPLQRQSFGRSFLSYAIRLYDFYSRPLRAWYFHSLSAMAEPSPTRMIVKQLKKPLLCERTVREEENRSLIVPWGMSSLRSKNEPLHLHRASNQQAKQCLQSLSPCRLKHGRERRKGCRSKVAAQLRTQ